MDKVGEVITCNGWMFDEEKYPIDQCIYVVAADIRDIKRLLTIEEMSAYKYYVYVNGLNYFKDFEMPKFNILFIDGWIKHIHSRQYDYAMINFAVKNSVKVMNYKGENGELLDAASTKKELRFHGIINNDSPISAVSFHPEVMSNQPERLKFEG